MHNEIPPEPELSAIRLSQACNWYLSEEKGGPCQLQSCWEMEKGWMACLKPKIVEQYACEASCGKPVDICCTLFYHPCFLHGYGVLWYNFKLYLQPCVIHSLFRKCNICSIAIECTLNNNSNSSCICSSVFPSHQASKMYYYSKPLLLK